MKEHEVKINNAELKMILESIRFQLPYLSKEDGIVARGVLDKLMKL